MTGSAIRSILTGHRKLLGVDIALESLLVFGKCSCLGESCKDPFLSTATKSQGPPV